MTNALRRADIPEPEIATRDGARARVERRGDVELLSVRDRAGRVLFEYDAETGRGALVVSEGDLRLVAPRGCIELVAANGVRVASHGPIALESAALKVAASETDLELGDARANASTLVAAVENAELKFGKVLRSAERVIEQAGNFYQRISELCEMKVGRLRTIAKEGVVVKGEDVTLVAKKNARIDAERINLG